MNIVAVICARGGSKGLPNKNLRELNGIPLVAHSIRVAKESKLINRVIVSTDSIEIGAVAKLYGAEVPFIRPDELAQDNSPELDVWKHAVQNVDMDVFVSLPPTAPLRSVWDVESCINQLLGTDADIVITVRQAVRNPYFNMVQLDKKGYVHVVIPSEAYQRQQCPPVFDITTVCYATQPEYILSAQSVLEGKVKAILVPYERSIDIDTEVDLKIAEALIANH